MAHSEKYVSGRSQFTYIWTVQNMCSPCFVESPTFTVQAMDSTKWLLDIQWNSSEYMTVRIWRLLEEDEPNSIEIKYEISVLGIDGLPLIKKVDVNKFSYINSDQCITFADSCYVFTQRREEFLPNDALTVCCRMWRTGTEVWKPETCFARTVLRFNRPSFVWAVREFSTLQRSEQRKVTVKAGEDKDPILKIFVTEKHGEEYISIGIENYNFLRSIKLCLLDCEGKVVKSEKIDRYYQYIFLFMNFFKKRSLMDNKVSLLPNDVLFLRCEIEMRPDIAWSGIENYSDLNSMSLGVISTERDVIIRREQAETSNVSSSFTGAMKGLLLKGTLSDINLRTGSRSFPAHKCILSARSPVFEAMFNRDMKEKTSQSVDIPDIDGDTLRELLSYIYTDTVVDLQWRGAADLYRAADKYELLDLKGICSTFLKSNVSVSNVCSVLVLGEMHHDQELRETAKDYIMKQDAGFFTSETWRCFKEENSELHLEILEQIVYNMKSHQ